MKLFKKIDLLLLVILVISAFLRFYNFREFQHWTGDEEVFTATIRHIIWDRSPTLLVQNSFLGFGLGPFYHYLLTPFYFLTNFNLVNLQAIASILGIATTFLVYIGGKMIGGRSLGLVASFLYASSFFISLFDRRVWPLTLDSFLASFTFVVINKVIAKDLRFVPLLAIPIGFSFHADPSLIVLVLTIIAVWIIFKLPIINRYTLYGILILIIFALPLILAEIRYDGAVSGPIIQSISRPLKSQAVAPKYVTFQASDFIGIFSKVIFTQPSDFIEKQLCFGLCNPPKSYISYINNLLVIVVFVASFILVFRNKPGNKKCFGVLIIMMASFIFGIFIWGKIFKGNINQPYFLVIFPIFILLLAQTIFLLHKRFKIVLLILLLFYFLINSYSLFNSSVKYPLYKKIKLVKKSSESIGSDKFSLYASQDSYIEGGGWTELYVLEKHPPVKSYWYGYWDWIYQAYSLYPGPIQKNDPEKIIWIVKADETISSSLPIISKYSYSDINIYIFDNSVSKTD